MVLEPKSNPPLTWMAGSCAVPFAPAGPKAHLTREKRENQSKCNHFVLSNTDGAILTRHQVSIHHGGASDRPESGQAGVARRGERAWLARGSRRWWWWRVGPIPHTNFGLVSTPGRAAIVITLTREQNEE